MAAGPRKRRPAATRKPKSAGTPGWIWLLMGLTLGLGAAVLFNLDRLPEFKSLAKVAPEPTTSKPAPKKEPPAKPKALPKPEETKGMAYDFYKILPEMEVPVPEAEGTAAGVPPPALDPGRYILQVGAFRNLKDADTQKAELALLGIASSIQTITVNGDDTWHRVRIGPLTDATRLDHVRNLLRKNDVAFVLLREKD